MSASKKTPAQRKAAAPAAAKQKYVPAFQGPIEGYVVNFLKSNVWRVARTMEFDDCLQEAYLVFARVCERYPDVEDAPHFMALFMTSWERAFIDMTRHDTRVRQTELPSVSDRYGEGDSEAAYEPVGELQNDGELSVVLRQAPREVLAVLNLMLRAPQELVEMVLGSWREDRRMRAGGSEHINRLLGFPEHYDSMGAVRDYFRGHLH